MLKLKTFNNVAINLCKQSYEDICHAIVVVERKRKRNSVSQTMCCIGYCCIKTAVAQAVKPLKKMVTHSQNNITATHNTTLVETRRQRRFICQLNKITMMY